MDERDHSSESGTTIFLFFIKMTRKSINLFLFTKLIRFVKKKIIKKIKKIVETIT